jgi:hypothetical protein
MPKYSAAAANERPSSVFRAITTNTGSSASRM